MIDMAEVEVARERIQQQDNIDSEVLRLPTMKNQATRLANKLGLKKNKIEHRLHQLKNASDIVDFEQEKR